MVIAAAAAVLTLAVPAGAATITSANGVISVDTPDDSWKEISDAGSVLSLSDGKNVITIRHYSNGESVPAVAFASMDYKGICQSFVSTPNEVFVAEGKTLETTELQKVMSIIGTMKILQYDTKTAVPKAPAQTVNMEPAASNTAAQTAAPANTQNAPKPEGRGDSEVRGDIYDSINLYPYDSEESITVTMDANGVWSNSNGLTYVSNGDGTWTDGNGVTLYEYIVREREDPEYVEPEEETYEEPYEETYEPEDYSNEDDASSDYDSVESDYSEPASSDSYVYEEESGEESGEEQ